MPLLISSVQNPYRAIDRTLVDTIVTQLMDSGKLPSCDRYHHPDITTEARQVSIKGSTHLPGQSTIEVRPTYTFMEQSSWSLNQRWRQYRPLMLDKDLSVGIYPVYLDQQVTIEITYIDDSIEKLREIKDQLRTYISFGWRGDEHALTYNLIFSREVESLLSHLHELREAQLEYDEDLSTWFTKHSDGTLHVTQAGRHKEPAYTVRQVLMEGYINPELNNVEQINTGVYGFTFTYTFRHSRAMATVVEYPIQIHQQLVASEYTLNSNTHRPKGYLFSDTHIVRGLRPYRDIPSKVVRVPAFDNSPVDTFPYGYTPVWTILPQLYIDGNLELFSIEDMGELIMHPEIIKLIKEHFYADINIPYKTPFLISIHYNNHRMHDRYLQLDNNLILSLTEAIDLRKSYRISFSILTDLSALSDIALSKVNNSTAAQVFVDAVNYYSRHLHSDKGVNTPVVLKDLNSTIWTKHVAPLLPTENNKGHHRDITGYVSTPTAMSAHITAYRRASEAL